MVFNVSLYCQSEGTNHILWFRCTSMYASSPCTWPELLRSGLYSYTISFCKLWDTNRPPTTHPYQDFSRCTLQHALSASMRNNPRLPFETSDRPYILPASSSMLRRSVLYSVMGYYIYFCRTGDNRIYRLVGSTINLATPYLWLSSYPIYAITVNFFFQRNLSRAVAWSTLNRWYWYSRRKFDWAQRWRHCRWGRFTWIRTWCRWW